MKIPKNIITEEKPIKEVVKNKSSIERVKLNIDELKPFSYVFDDFDNEKLYAKYIRLCESLIRTSFEYKNFIKYIRDTQDLTFCKFLTNVDLNKINKVTVELHHYPFNLYEIVDTIIKKQTNFYTVKTTTFDICNEAMLLHYENLVGLVPLSKTVHELAHNGQVFINLNLVFGDVKKFIDEYEMFISDDLHNSIKVLRDLSETKELQTNNYILKKKFQQIVTSGLNRKLQPIVSKSEEVKLA